jgi:hypothetical protein
MADMRETRSGKQAVCNPLGISARSGCFGGERADYPGPVSLLERGLLKAMLRALGNPPVALVPWRGKPILNARGEAKVRAHPARIDDGAGTDSPSLTRYAPISLFYPHRHPASPAKPLDFG